MCDVKLRNTWYGGATMQTCILCEPRPLNVIILWCLLMHGNHSTVVYAYVCTKSDHLQACIEPRPSIDYCCRLQRYYPGKRDYYPCSMSASHGIAAVQSTCITPLHHSHLFEAHPGAYKLAGATCSAMHHTYWSITKPISYCGYLHSYVPTIR